MTKKKKSNKDLKIILFSLGGIILLVITILFLTSNLSKLDSCKSVRSDLQVGCYINKSINEGKISFCNKIDDQDMGFMCRVMYAIANNDSSICSQENKSNKNGCYYLYAKEKNDPSICEMIQDEIYRSFCYDMFKENETKTNNVKNTEEPLEDIFETQKYKEYINSNKEKLDCNLKSNYDKEKLDLAFDYNCYFNEKSTQYAFGACDGMQGIDKLDADVDRYPSLNENYFNSASLTLTNRGCTKLELQNYKIKYQLIQENKILADEDKGLLYSLRSFNNQDVNYLYPEEYGFLNLDFNDRVSFSDSNYVYFRVCIYNKDNLSEAVCNEVKI